MTTATNEGLREELCRAFGLEPAQVDMLIISMEHGGEAKVHARFRPLKGQEKEAVSSFAEYRLEPK